MAANHQLDDELRPDAEASRIIEDRDLMDIDIKELNKMLKERNVSKELAVRQKPITMHCQEIVTVATNVKRAICDLSLIYYIYLYLIYLSLICITPVYSQRYVLSDSESFL